MDRIQYDVIVVGAGGSGLAAAVSAAQHGGQVLVLEKRPQPGGTTGMAVGSFTAANTTYQRAAGIQDDPAAHIEDAAKFAAPDIEVKNNDPLRAYFLHEAATTLEWLRTLGVSFIGPNPEPPNRVPRMHNVVPGARAYIAAFQEALRNLDAQLVCRATVQQLLRGASGRVIGVQAVVGNKARKFFASRGVVLAAGDYANNPELIARHSDRPFRGIEGINPYATGEGHLLAQQAGAQLLNMDVTYGPELRFVPSFKKPFPQRIPVHGRWSRVLAALARRLPPRVMQAIIRRLLVTWQHPESSLFQDGAILVNRTGRRFVNEKSWPEREIRVAGQPNKVAFILLDGRLIDRYSQWPHFISTAPDIAYAYVADYRRLRPDVTTWARSLDHLALRHRLDGKALQQTVAEFNDYVRGGRTDAFGRTADRNPLANGPWLLLGPVKAFFTTTEGGVAVNERLQGLDEQGNVIPGLFAVGQNGLGGMILWGHGLHIAWAMTSGRLAGQFVMQEP